MNVTIFIMHGCYANADIYGLYSLTHFSERDIYISTLCLCFADTFPNAGKGDILKLQLKYPESEGERINTYRMDFNDRMLHYRALFCNH